MSSKRSCALAAKPDPRVTSLAQLKLLSAKSKCKPANCHRMPGTTVAISLFSEDGLGGGRELVRRWLGGAASVGANEGCGMVGDRGPDEVDPKNWAR